VLAIDPRAAEAFALRAAVEARSKKNVEAMATAAEAIRMLGGDPPSRLYDAEAPEKFREHLEDFIVEMGAHDPDEGARRSRPRQGAPAPRRAERRCARRRADGAPPDWAWPCETAAPKISPVATLRSLEKARGSVPRAGRTNPCPCGSGKKFKKCHGKGT